ncbi:hypothetical protein NUW58_g682 [Xylaria curta]|uniref:Uncharacterized protein n=1 Tax=Xylaria curta TaxID=42375 RepID=A0ACC1PNA5_9PEZI|nr:hypothetical protein NUW58_g682 [Xylaria curta]
MDDYEYEQFANEYLQFPPSIDEGDYPATIDPALLQFSDPALEFLIEQQQQQQPELDDQSWVRPSGGDFGPDLGPPAHGARFSVDGFNPHSSSSLPIGTAAPNAQGAMHEHATSPDAEEHYVVSENPFKCACGVVFTRLYTLERHIQGADKQRVPGYPCHECPAYQGKNGFRRKDHLVQHLKFFHKYSDDQLSAGTSSRRTRRFNISVCCFSECDYYRGPEFRDLGIDQQNDNRPFDKQSDYTNHMKREHNWSPYPCKVSGCSKVGGNGFFTTGTLEKHYKEKHPKSKVPATTPPDRVKDTARCEYCQKGMNPGSVASHWRLGFEISICETPAKGRLNVHVAVNSWKGGKWYIMKERSAKGKPRVAFALNAWSLDSWRSIMMSVREKQSANGV